MAAGETIAVMDDKTKKIIGYFIGETPIKPKRQSGILEGKVTINFGPDWEMTDEEFLGLNEKKI